MKLNHHVRNVAIIALIAAAIVAVPGGGPASAFFFQAISLLFLAALAWIASRLYREHRMSLETLGEKRRLILYTAIGVIVLTLTATRRLLDTGAGSVAWIVLLVASGYAIFWVYRTSREY